jgi:hypothetical protein
MNCAFNFDPISASDPPHDAAEVVFFEGGTEEGTCEVGAVVLDEVDCNPRRTELIRYSSDADGINRPGGTRCQLLGWVAARKILLAKFARGSREIAM